jgi:tetratricopeptide (TPR) repeat protein
MRTFLIMTLLSVVLFETTAVAQAVIVKETLFYSPKILNTEMNEAKTNFARLIKETKCNDENRAIYYTNSPKNVMVFDDRVEIIFKNHTGSLRFSDLLNYNIEVFYEEYAPGMLARNYYQLVVGKFIFYSFSSGVDSFKELADYLRFFQNRQFDLQFALFEPIAAQYRALKVKPMVSEGQREFIVQANSFNQQKNYLKAIDLYNKAIDLDQTAYPAAYSNLALLSAQTGKFNTAIYYMKKYLLLEPEAADARSAQDKIYEWKAQITN